jgi:hypothetical protein
VDARNKTLITCLILSLFYSEDGGKFPPKFGQLQTRLDGVITQITLSFFHTSSLMLLPTNSVSEENLMHDAT